MTSENRAQVVSAVVPFAGHKAQVGHKMENYLFPHKPLFFLIFLTKRHKAQDKEGGHSQNKKGGKMAEKEGKRGKYIFYRQNGKSLCLAPFAKSRAMA